MPNPREGICWRCNEDKALTHAITGIEVKGLRLDRYVCTACALAWKSREVVHQCPPGDAGTMPCCGRTPFEVSPGERITLDPELVTCGTPNGGQAT
jgi:hypothetical protein